MGGLALKNLLLGLVFSACASAAIAADAPTPVYKAPPPNAAPTSDWYVSFDGAWQRVNLPDYGLGFRRVTVSPFTDAGPFQKFRPSFDGPLFSGTLGYFLPPALSNTLFGSNSRLEIGGYYSRASGSASGTAAYTGGGVITQTLNGAGANGGWVCSPTQICTTNSNLSTKYSDWRLYGRIAGDYRFGAILATPSFAVFGGATRTDQTLAQDIQIAQVPAHPTYGASTSLPSTDVGARVGLDLTVDVTPAVALGLGGWGGFARRYASLSGTDVAVDPIGNLIAGASAISTKASATPFVGNAEAGVAFKWLPALTVRGFAGLNYDSKVPGVASSSFVGGVGGITSRSPASIAFSAETSYYAGAAVTWTLGSAAP
jgi:hypothetical protein